MSAPSLAHRLRGPRESNSDLLLPRQLVSSGKHPLQELETGHSLGKPKAIRRRLKHAISRED